VGGFKKYFGCIETNDCNVLNDKIDLVEAVKVVKAVRPQNWQATELSTF